MALPPSWTIGAHSFRPPYLTGKAEHRAHKRRMPNGLDERSQASLLSSETGIERIAPIQVLYIRFIRSIPFIRVSKKDSTALARPYQRHECISWTRMSTLHTIRVHLRSSPFICGSTGVKTARSAVLTHHGIIDYRLGFDPIRNSSTPPCIKATCSIVWSSTSPLNVTCCT